ncbi:MAG: hypothetical protein HZB26_03400 [Candidatus Hydrogenedentes bacterium]|nr:hypothetical protein [Candidatus Hydrogenedentota bacterium]
MPVPRVRVAAVNEHTGSAEFCASTDDRGFYALTGLRPETGYIIEIQCTKEGYRVVDGPGWVKKPRFVQEHGPMDGYKTIDWPGWIKLADGEILSDLDIVLATGGSVLGKIVDMSVSYDMEQLPAVLRNFRGDNENALFRKFMREAERPMSGVRIMLVEAADTAAKRVIQQTVSDETGRYVLADCPAGQYAIVAEPPAGAVIMNEKHSSRYRPVDIPASKDVSDVDFSFRLDSVSVAGRVTGISGKPIHDVQLSAELPVRDRGDGFTVLPDAGKVEATTDEQGLYCISGLTPMHIIHAAGIVWSNGESGGGEHAYRIRARGSGYATAQVDLPAIPRALADTAKAFIKAYMNEASLRDIPDERKVPPPSTQLLQYDPGGAIRVDLALEREATVSGRLIDTRGIPLASGSVRLAYAEPEQGQPKLLEIKKVIPDDVKTDESGGFGISKIPAGRYVFQTVIDSVGLLHARNEPLELRAGDTIRDLELIVESADDRGDLTGTVRDVTTNEPIPNFTVAVSAVASPSEPYPRYGDVTNDEAKKSFVIRGVSHGTATLQLSAPGYPPVEVQARVESGRTSTVIGYLAPEGRIEGIVTLNGVSVSGRVSVRLADGRPILESGSGAVPLRAIDATPDGAFSIQGLSPGEYLVRADALANPGPPPSYRYSWTKANVVAGRATRVNLTVEGFTTIHGSFLFPETYKYGWIQVYEGHVPASSPMEDEEAAWRLVRATADLSGQSGPYEITNLSPGTYTVIAFCFGRKGKTGAEYEQDRHHVSHLVTVGDGEELELNLEIETPP